MGGHPIGWQPRRPGTLRAFHGGGSINIYHKEVHNNYGVMFPMPNYGYAYGSYDTGLTKGEKWGIGLAGGLMALGAGLGIYNAITGNKENQSTVEQPQTKTVDNTAQLEQETKQLEEENSKLKKQIQDMMTIKEQSDAYQQQQNYNAGAREVKDKPSTTSYTVRGIKNSDGTVTGDTGYNIVAGLYKGPGGKALTSTQISAIANKIFDGKALKVGDIELPNTVEVDGQTFSLDETKTKTIEDMHNSITTQTYGLAKHDIYQSGAKQQGSHWIATLNGQDLPGQYNTEAEAKAAAEKEGKKAQSGK